MWANMSWSQPAQRRALEAWSVASFRAQCLYTRTVQRKASAKASAKAGGQAGKGANANAEVMTLPESEMQPSPPPAPPPPSVLPSVLPSLPLPPPLPLPSPVNQEKRTMVQQQMASLEAYGLPLYPRYSDMERQLLYPRRSWTVVIPGHLAATELVLH